MTRTLFGAVRNKPAVAEFTIQVQVADVLTRWGNPDWRWTHLPFGEHRSAITGARLKRMGTQRGWPDFILLPPVQLVPNMLRRTTDSDFEGRSVSLYPRPHFLELKRKGGTLSLEQELLQGWMWANGYPYEVADNFKSAIDILQDWGAVRAKVSV